MLDARRSSHTTPTPRRSWESRLRAREREVVDPRIAVPRPALRQTAEEGVDTGASAGEEPAVRDDDHTALAAGEHDVHSIEGPEEAGGGGADDGDDDIGRFVTWRGQLVKGARGTGEGVGRTLKAIDVIYAVPGEVFCFQA